MTTANKQQKVEKVKEVPAEAQKPIPVSQLSRTQMSDLKEKMDKPGAISILKELFNASVKQGLLVVNELQLIDRAIELLDVY